MVYTYINTLRKKQLGQVRGNLTLVSQSKLHVHNLASWNRQYVEVVTASQHPLHIQLRCKGTTLNAHSFTRFYRGFTQKKFNQVFTKFYQEEYTCWQISSLHEKRGIWSPHFVSDQTKCDIKNNLQNISVWKFIYRKMGTSKGIQSAFSNKQREYQQQGQLNSYA